MGSRARTTASGLVKRDRVRRSAQTRVLHNASYRTRDQIERDSTPGRSPERSTIHCSVGPVRYPHRANSVEPMSFFQVTVDEVLARVEAVRTCPQCPGAGYVDAEPGERHRPPSRDVRAPHPRHVARSGCREHVVHVPPRDPRSCPPRCRSPPRPRDTTTRSPHARTAPSPGDPTRAAHQPRSGGTRRDHRRRSGSANTPSGSPRHLTATAPQVITGWAPRSVTASSSAIGAGWAKSL